ncbi:hypothetical protein MMC25_005580 [Agyrium rufum]|nr:hypothetical protein [Agyrium rufum]
MATDSPPPSTYSSRTASPSPAPAPTKKRKRLAGISEELEIDITAPEPPSKKALRKAKKNKKQPLQAQTDNDGAKASSKTTATTDQPSTSEATVPDAVKRSPHGVWVGNLPWTATKDMLQTFFTSKATLAEQDITRIHMPPPKETPVSAARQHVRPQNRGFAYVDFKTEDQKLIALGLSEKLLMGRALLIKDATSFEGRPDPLIEDQDAVVGDKKKMVSKRVFVGNLNFDATTDELREHFGQCGVVQDVFLATFQDSGKCKGYGWVTFDDTEASTAAVRGWIPIQKSSNDDNSAEEEEGRNLQRSKRPRKQWVNMIKGRLLRMEFAEDPATRYKKRFGKNDGHAKVTNGDGQSSDVSAAANESIVDGTDATAQRKSRGQPRGKKTEKEKIADRLTGSIVASEGKKITFE